MQHPGRATAGAPDWTGGLSSIRMKPIPKPLTNSELFVGCPSKSPVPDAINGFAFLTGQPANASSVPSARVSSPFRTATCPTSGTSKGKTVKSMAPVPRSELDQWYAEGRITADCQILQQEADQWQWATDLYPDLVPEEPVQSETFSLGENKVCPVCGGQILAVAKKCKHCGEFLVKDMRRESQTVRSETDVFAILTLITGVVGLWPLCLIFSIVSHNRPKNNAHLTGKGIRYFGVVLGALWAIFTMVQLGIW